MIFARKVWHLLVAIKDGLVLLVLMLFFTLLYAALTMRPNVGAVREGALLVTLKGSVVEEPAPIDPLSLLASGGDLPAAQYRARDLVRALDTAATDGRIKAVVLDLAQFTGGGLVHMQDLGAAMDRVRAAGKPVLTYAIGYNDDGVMLAAHASEAWLHPLGAAWVLGPGGQSPYFGALLDKLKVTAHVFRVGTYKDFVEPYVRDSMSEPARAARTALLGSLFESWKADVLKARPKANLALVTSDPAAWFQAARGDGAAAAKNAGLVDRIGDRTEFGARVAQLVGKDPADRRAGAFVHSSLKVWLAANTAPSAGRTIGVVTIAGDIVDGKAGPGTAGGERITQLLDSAEAQKLAALVIRVDSPGGSVLASEQIRKGIERIKARGIPVAVSMANVAASGGYWVATPGARIFAEPGTITGSIGIFAVVPSFERTLADYGIKSDGVRTTPLSGQPDLVGGFTPEMNAMLQSTIEAGYGRFIGLVARSRGKTVEQVDAVAQGRIWDGGTARQLGLVDQFGGLDDALAWAAGQAKLGKGAWHAVYLGEDRNPYASLIEKLAGGEDDGAAPEQGDVFAQLAGGQRDALLRTLGGLERLLGARGAQAYCLGCPEPVVAPPSAELPGWMMVAKKLLN